MNFALFVGHGRPWRKIVMVIMYARVAAIQNIIDGDG